MSPSDPRALRERLEDISAALPFEVTIRPMMGGYIGYADGRPFVSLSTGGFGVKLLPAAQDRLLLRPGAERLRHAPDQPPSKTYIALAPGDLNDDSVLVDWLTLAGRTAPVTKKRSR